MVDLVEFENRIFRLLLPRFPRVFKDFLDGISILYTRRIAKGPDQKIEMLFTLLIF